MEIIILSAFLGWCLCGLLAAGISSSRGNGGCTGFLLGFLLGPLGVIIVALSPPSKTTVLQQQADSDFSRLMSGELKKCPYCAELVKAEAKICRYCGREVGPALAPTPVTPVGISDGSFMRCPICGTKNYVMAERCEKCGIGFIRPTQERTFFNKYGLQFTNRRIIVNRYSYPFATIQKFQIARTVPKLSYMIKAILHDGREVNVFYSKRQTDILEIADYMRQAANAFVQESGQIGSSKETLLIFEEIDEGLVPVIPGATAAVSRADKSTTGGKVNTPQVPQAKMPANSPPARDLLICPKCGEKNPPFFKLCGTCQTPLVKSGTSGQP